MVDLVELRAQFPVWDAVGHGTESYPVYPDGTVWVPQEAVPGLLRTGGYIMARSAAPAAIPPGMTWLRHADGYGCSWDGVAYDADRNGVVTVPAAAVGDLMAHGFEPVAMPEPAAAEPAPAAAEPAPAAAEPAPAAAEPAPEPPAA